VAADGAAMRTILAKDSPEVTLLDLVLPGDDGLVLSQEIRAKFPEAGIIMLTGRNDMIDCVIGLEMGADDYIAKPFHLREVLARIRSLLRRVQAAHDMPKVLHRQIFHFEGWSLDLGRRQLTSPVGRDVTLTSGEFDLLQVFVQHPQRILKRTQLMEITKGRGWDAYDRSIDIQVVRLRKKIETDPKNPSLIKSIRSVGYIFTAEVQFVENS
jgi:two-component system phosphate regulon response regulator OmpR